MQCNEHANVYPSKMHQTMCKMHAIKWSANRSVQLHFIHCSYYSHAFFTRLSNILCSDVIRCLVGFVA